MRRTYPKRLSSIALLFILSSYSGFAQTTIMQNVGDLSDQYRLEKSKGAISMVDVKGSPYLEELFFPGEIVVNDSLVIKDVPLRYNIYNDRFEFTNEDGQVLEIGIMDNDFTYTIQNKVFSTLNYSDRGEEKRGILELLVDGNVRLYKQYIVHFKEATKSAGYQDAQPNRFVRQSDEYLLSISDGMPQTIRKSKLLLGDLTKVKPDIEVYAKEQKLKLKSEDGLLRLFKYCNQ